MRDALFPPTCPGPRLNPHKEPRARETGTDTPLGAEAPLDTRGTRGQTRGLCARRVSLRGHRAVLG